jgi:hypothetical protein
VWFQAPSNRPKVCGQIFLTLLWIDSEEIENVKFMTGRWTHFGKLKKWTTAKPHYLMIHCNFTVKKGYLFKKKLTKHGKYAVNQQSCGFKHHPIGQRSVVRFF